MTPMPDILHLAGRAARHAAARQTVIAGNVANADTPGYRARTLATFAAAADALPLRRTHAAHLPASARDPRVLPDRAAPADPNGNTVSLERQILAGVDAARAHDRAVAVYGATLDVLRAALGKR